MEYLTQQSENRLNQIEETQELQTFTVDPAEQGKRVDLYLSEQMGKTRSHVQTLLNEGRVHKQDKALKPNYKVKPGDVLQVELPPPLTLEARPENIPLDILYEDDDVIVLNKARGMVVHPAPNHYTGTLVNALLYHCKTLSGINGVIRPGIVHRLDKDTSGIMIAAKNDAAHLALSRQIQEKTARRTYLCVVRGNVKTDAGVIETRIDRDKNDRKKMAVNHQNGKRAVTHYRVLQRFQGYTYIECVLETGRTHQIRVHMASIGHPLLGDEVYSNRKSPFKLQGQTLHAKTLGFIHPTTGEYLEIEAPLPEYFEHLLTVLEK